jgi:dephospho-CoA kinase
VIGVTGAPAAGKSTASRLLGDAGCSVIDVDAMGHEALATETVRDAVVAEFGDGLVDGDGRLDRAALARVAFADAASVGRLEAIVHPAVRRRLDERLRLAQTSPGPRAIVIDCALLFESGLDEVCDATICVDTPRPQRAARAATRGWDADELARRESHQLAAEEKRRRADHVLPNADDPVALSARIGALLDEVAPLDTPRPSGGGGGNPR